MPGASRISSQPRYDRFDTAPNDSAIITGGSRKIKGEFFLQYSCCFISVLLLYIFGISAEFFHFGILLFCCCYFASAFCCLDCPGREPAELFLPVFLHSAVLSPYGGQAISAPADKELKPRNRLAQGLQRLQGS